MRRVLFSKTGDAIWISHLDLMRVFQRSFRRAGLMLKHSQGFSPRAIVSIALPLSVGVDSRCEILDFELVGEAVSDEEIKIRLNQALPLGVRVEEVYDSSRKQKELTHLQARLALEYDKGVPEGAQTAIAALFQRESLMVEKKSKKGVTSVDILPMVQKLEVSSQPDGLVLNAVICAQNPSLNPSLLAEAIAVYLPEFTPDFVKISRLEVLDGEGEAFR